MKLSKTYEVIDKHFTSILAQYELRLEKSLKGSDCLWLCWFIISEMSIIPRIRWITPRFSRMDKKVFSRCCHSCSKPWQNEKVHKQWQKLSLLLINKLERNTFFKRTKGM